MKQLCSLVQTKSNKTEAKTLQTGFFLFWLLDILPTQTIHTILFRIKPQLQSYCMLTEGFIETETHLLNTIYCTIFNRIDLLWGVNNTSEWRAEKRPNPSYAELYEGH